MKNLMIEALQVSRSLLVFSHFSLNKTCFAVCKLKSMIQNQTKLREHQGHVRHVTLLPIIGLKKNVKLQGRGNWLPEFQVHCYEGMKTRCQEKQAKNKISKKTKQQKCSENCPDIDFNRLQCTRVGKSTWESFKNWVADKSERDMDFLESVTGNQLYFQILAFNFFIGFVCLCPGLGKADMAKLRTAQKTNLLLQQRLQKEAELMCAFYHINCTQ